MSKENDKTFEEELEKLKAELELIKPTASGSVANIPARVRHQYQIHAYYAWVDPPIKFDNKKKKN